jgi:SagB-type dehydrogenase family enzyme
LCYWSAGFVLYNYETRLATTATPFAVELLEFFTSARSIADVQRRFNRYPSKKIAQAIRSLAGRGLLERVGEGRTRSALAKWASWNPAAGFFHFSTKDVRFGGADSEPPPQGTRPPPAVKRFPGARRLPLSHVHATGEFASVLKERRTWRRFSQASLGVASLATLLGLTFRMQRRPPEAGSPRMVLRTSPSPGARHALEAYLLARNVEGLPRGLYHYAADRHELEQIGSRATLRPIPDYLPTQDWYRDAAALVFITAVFPRVWWRYDYPRAYRAVLIEAGHFCQTFLLTATWLGLAPFCSMALADSLIERDLGIDGVTESVLYAAGVGVRPPGVEWAPTPAPKRGRMSR